jgi:predicted secreted protein
MNKFKLTRRNFIKGLSLYYFCLLPFQTNVVNAHRNIKNFFDYTDKDKLFDDLSFSDLDLGNDKNINLKTPDIAENGSIVPIQIESFLNGEQTFYVFSSKNENPLTSIYHFHENMVPFVSTRLKLQESSKLHVFIKFNSNIVHAANDIEVTIGGCGEETIG